MNNRVSVIIPCFNERSYIQQNVEAVVGQTFNKENLEVFYIDGGSQDGTIEILETYAKTHKWLHILNNPQKTVPFALNTGIAAASGDLIIRMDVHTYFPPNYIEKLVDWMQYLDADNIGGVCYTDVLQKNKISEAIRIVMSDRYGVGNSMFRLGSNKLREVDTVPFGCYKKDVFDRIGNFDVRLERNQDIEFNKRLKRADGKIYLLPDVHCTYFSRDTLLGLFKNRFKTGKWIVTTSFLTKSLRNLSLRHFIPLIFVLSMLLPMVLSIVFPLGWIITIAVFLAYLFVLGNRAQRLKNPSTSTSHIFIAFSVLHFSYGLGSLVGLLNIAKYFKA
jgi:glycosyltransferase involved in cell wall biosynthesis